MELSGWLEETGLSVTKTLTMEKEEQKIREELQLVEARLQKIRIKGSEDAWRSLLRKKAKLTLRLEQIRDTHGERD